MSLSFGAPIRPIDCIENRSIIQNHDSNSGFFSKCGIDCSRFISDWAAMKEVQWAKLNDQHQQKQHPNGHFSPLKLGKLLDPEASWEKDQLGDVLHWIRQVVALACGLLCGAIPLVGGIWIVVFLLISFGIVYTYYAMILMILKVDEEEFGGHGTLLQEGFFASITLSWILVYSMAHF